MVSRRTIGLISRDDYNKTKRVHTEPELEKSERLVPETSSSSSLLDPHYFPIDLVYMSINLKRPHLTNPCTSPRLPEKKNCQGKKFT